jgi:hypothetical protein
MGVRTRGLDIKAGAAKLKADQGARLEAELVIDRWNRRLGQAATCCGLRRAARPARILLKCLSQPYAPECRRVAGRKAIPTGQPNRRVLCLAHGGAL